MSDISQILKIMAGAGGGGSDSSAGGAVGKGGGGPVGTAAEPFNPAARLASGVSQGAPAPQSQMPFMDLMKMYQAHKEQGGVKDTSMANDFGAGDKIVSGTGKVGKGGASG